MTRRMEWRLTALTSAVVAGLLLWGFQATGQGYLLFLSTLFWFSAFVNVLRAELVVCGDGEVDER